MFYNVYNIKNKTSIFTHFFRRLILWKKSNQLNRTIHFQTRKTVNSLVSDLAWFRNQGIWKIWNFKSPEPHSLSIKQYIHEPDETWGEMSQGYKEGRIINSQYWYALGGLSCEVRKTSQICVTFVHNWFVEVHPRSMGALCII